MYHAKRTIAGVRPEKICIFSYFVSRFRAKTGKYEDSGVERKTKMAMEEKDWSQRRL